MKVLHATVIFAFVISFVATAPAQNKELKFIEEAGLGNAEIRLLIKDETGALWIGTDTAGLFRYDGDSWIRYTEEDGLPGNQARYGAIDHDGALWIGGAFGTTRFDGQSWVTYTPENSGLSGKTIWNLTVDANNVKWFASSNLERFDGTTWETVYIPTETQMFVTAVEFDRDGNLWVGTGNGVVCYDGESWIDYPPSDSDVGPMSVLSIACDKKNTVWFAGYGGVVRYDGQTWKRYNRYYDPNRERIVDVGACYTVYIDDYETVYFGRGLYYDAARDSITANVDIQAGSNTLLYDRGIWWLGNRSGLSVFADYTDPSAVDVLAPTEAFTLMQPYPNPFNGRATIDFTIPRDGYTSLSIYSLSGQKVRDLFSGYLAAGLHSKVWNGTTDLGAPVSSGVYFIRLTGKEQHVTGRITYIK